MKAFDVMATVINSKQLLLDLDWETRWVKMIILESDEVGSDLGNAPKENKKSTQRLSWQYKRG